MNTYRAIGLMSGTSLDGLDLAYCSFSQYGQQWSFELLQSANIAYSETFRAKLQNSVNASGQEILLLHIEYGQWLGEQVAAFIEKYELEPDLVASHGHTIFHQPEKNFTFQLGHGQAIANKAQIPVICDFRTADVLLGGQGAPLVPIGDQHLFSDYDFCLNLGGIANVSFELQGQRVAFDICAANMLLNYLMKSTGKAFDDKGELARSGTLNQPLFEHLNTLDYFAQPFPKSLGYEWFRDELQPIIDRSVIPLQDQLCTAVHHIAYQIQLALAPHIRDNQQLLATGGGTFNDFLIQTLQAYLGLQTRVITPPANIIEFKEAIVFAFMGVLRHRNEVNCLASVTGAPIDSCSGNIFRE